MQATATMGPWTDAIGFVLGGVSFTVTTPTPTGVVVRRWNCLGWGALVPFAETARVDPVHDALVLAELDLLTRAPSLPPGPAALAAAAAALVGDGPVGARASLELGDQRETARRMLLAQVLVHLAVAQGDPALAGTELVLATASLSLGADAVLLAKLRTACPNLHPHCPAVIEQLVTFLAQLDAGRAAMDRGDLVLAGWTGAVVVDQASRVGPPF